MKIAFLHFHLKPGGVATVIRQQIDSLKEYADILTISGDKGDIFNDVKNIVIPDINYNDSGDGLNPKDIADNILKSIKEIWSNGADIIHVHNPTLKKNVCFLKILKELKNRGQKLFLQIHDFAEDGRPNCYYFDEEYIENCHYGVINTRDYNILRNSGLKEEGLHKIFNIVKKFDFDDSHNKDDEIILYPIRSIRRKNVGEAILLTLLLGNKNKLSITLPPNSETDISIYNTWKTFASSNNLNVEFESGLNNELPDLIKKSKYIITTSVNEGFGFSFLEPWTASRAVVGRRLPHVCVDFESFGIDFSHLYKKLLIPLHIINKDEFYNVFKTNIIEIAKRFRINITEETIKDGFNNLIKDDVIDFSYLSEKYHMSIIKSILSSEDIAKEIISLNKWLEHFEDKTFDTSLINNNNKLIREAYTHDKYREHLLKIYNDILEKEVTHKIDKETLLKSYISIEDFQLIKWTDFTQVV